MGLFRSDDRARRERLEALEGRARQADVLAERVRELEAENAALKARLRQYEGDEAPPAPPPSFTGSASELPGYNELLAKRDWMALSRLLEAAIPNAPGEEAAIALTLELGDVLTDKLRNVDEACGAYRRVLESSPHNAVALDRLEQIYRSQHMWGELVGILERRATKGTAEQRADVLAQLAEIYIDYLGDESEGTGCLERAFAIDPHNATAHALNARLRS